MIFKKTPVLLANGTFPKHEFPLKILKNADNIICLDGAINTLIEKKITPSFIMGDLDSILPKYRKKFSDIIIEMPDQEENDLRKALKWLDERKYPSVFILGATGLREDHEISNIFSILETDCKINAKIITDYGIFQIIKGKEKIKSFKGQPVSLFTLNKQTKITTSMLKYNLNKSKLMYFYSGSLNQSLSSHFSVEVEKGSALLYLAYSK